MEAEESLRRGEPEQALAQLQDQVRREPANPRLRVFLFQLLALLGRWERALTQLKVAGELDSNSLLMVQTYREAIQCEALRAAVFEGRRTPLVFGDPSHWVALLIEALRLEQEGRPADACALRAQALEQAPASAGTIDDQEFAWVADADSRLGPVLEAIVNGQYYWIPIHRVTRLEIEAPADLRDLIWMPAQFFWVNGGNASALIPTRYAGSDQSADPQILMARKTEWTEIGANSYRGYGQRLLATDRGDYPLMDVRRLQLTVAAE